MTKRGKDEEKPLSVRRHEVCRWVADLDPDVDKWDTDCGESFCFTEGGPHENKMRFCCYCGRKLKVGRA
jgi:hypothetical protein